MSVHSEMKGIKQHAAAMDAADAHEYIGSMLTLGPLEEVTD